MSAIENKAFEDVDKDALQRDLEEIKANLGLVGEEDYQHLLKLERWGRGSTLGGFFLIFMATALEISIGLSTFGFWTLGIIASVLIGMTIDLMVGKTKLLRVGGF